MYCVLVTIGRYGILSTYAIVTVAALDDKSNIGVLQPEEAFVTETDQKNKRTVEQR